MHTKLLIRNFRLNNLIWIFVLTLENLLFRLEDSGASLRELDEMTQLGQEFYAESGELMKLVGVLRAIDIHWNEAKR
jgi:hypothetical protein